MGQTILQSKKSQRHYVWRCFTVYNTYRKRQQSERSQAEHPKTFKQNHMGFLNCASNWYTDNHVHTCVCIIFTVQRTEEAILCPIIPCGNYTSINSERVISIFGGDESEKINVKAVLFTTRTTQNLVLSASEFGIYQLLKKKIIGIWCILMALSFYRYLWPIINNKTSFLNMFFFTYVKQNDCK